MALSEETILQQINVLTTKTSENPKMEYKTIPALNKGLDPEHFTGNDTKIVNAINKIAMETKALNTAVIGMISRVNELISDMSSEVNRAVWEETMKLMNADNIVEGMKNLAEGKLIDKMLNLQPADDGKLLSVITDAYGNISVKPVSPHAIDIEVDAYSVSYVNRDLKGIKSIGEAIDVICESRINNIAMINDNMTILSSDNQEIASVPLMNDSDVLNIISALDSE